MPITPISNAPFDPANTASKLPEPLQKPGGVLLSLLSQLGGGDDPASGIMGSAAPEISIFKDAAGVPDKVLRQEGTQRFLQSAKDSAIKGMSDAADLFAEKYPRIAAHMNIDTKEDWMPGMAQTKSPYGKITKPVNVQFATEQPFPLNVLAHEATHVAQDLGNSDSLKLYDLVNQHNRIGMHRNPFEKTARYAGTKMEEMGNDGDWTIRPPNAIKELRQFVESDPNRAPRSPYLPPPEGIHNTSQAIFDILKKRAEQNSK